MSGELKYSFFAGNMEIFRNEVDSGFAIKTNPFIERAKRYY